MTRPFTCQVNASPFARLVIASLYVYRLIHSSRPCDNENHSGSSSKAGGPQCVVPEKTKLCYNKGGA